MHTGALQRVDRWARMATPFAVGVALAVVGVLPWPLPGVAPVTPALPLALVYFWTLRRRETVPPVAVFVIGLTQDLLGGTPLGLNALVLLLAQGAVLARQRLFARQPFAVAWWGFAVVAAGAAVALWALGSLWLLRPIHPGPFAVQLLLSVALYPLLSWVFAWIDALVLRDV